MPAAKRKRRVNTGAGLTDEQIKEANSKANKLSATARKLVQSSNTDLSQDKGGVRLRSGRILSDGSKKGKRGANKLRAAKRGKISTTTTGNKKTTSKKVTGKKTTAKKVTGKKGRFDPKTGKLIGSGAVGRKDPNRAVLSDPSGRKARVAYAATAQAGKKKLGEDKKFTRSQKKQVKAKLQNNPTKTKLVGDTKTGTYRAVKQSLDELTGLVKGLIIARKTGGHKARMTGVNVNTRIAQKPNEGSIRSNPVEVPDKNAKYINTVGNAADEQPNPTKTPKPKKASAVLNETFNTLLDNYQIKYKMRYDKNGKLISGSGIPSGDTPAKGTTSSGSGINIQTPQEAKLVREEKERQRAHAQG
jgi:hypothetical protein